MPIYEFQCNACGHRFDELMRMSDPEPTHCPSCNAEKVQRRVTAPSFRLAGSGWYETDFKGDKEKKRNLAGADKEEPKSESKTETKADAKPDSPKVEKAEAPKPVEKASKSASKPAAKRAKSKSKPARKRR